MSPLLDDEVEPRNEDFVSTFTLYRLRNDLMVLARDIFMEEYGVGKKSLGPKYKLLVQKQWNILLWMEVSNTKVFIWLMTGQMATKSRVKNKALHIRFSFGRLKAGLEFKAEREMENYVCQDFGDGIKFSQNEAPASPFLRMVRAVKREKC